MKYVHEEQNKFMNKEYKEAFLEEIATIDWSFIVDDLAYRF